MLDKTSTTAPLRTPRQITETPRQSGSSTAGASAKKTTHGGSDSLPPRHAAGSSAGTTAPRVAMTAEWGKPGHGHPAHPLPLAPNAAWVKPDQLAHPLQLPPSASRPTPSVLLRHGAGELNLPSQLSYPLPTPEELNLPSAPPPTPKRADQVTLAQLLQQPDEAGEPAHAAPTGNPSRPSRASAATRPLESFKNAEGELTQDAVKLLKSALPHAGEGIGKLMQRRARIRPQSAYDHMLQKLHGKPQPLTGERFGAFMRMVESDVKAVAKRGGLSIQDAAELMRLGLSQAGLDKKLSYKDKGQMLFALYGIREKQAAEQPLASAMAQHPAFQQLPVSDAWRVALDHSAWGDGKHHGLRFENEPGYMGGMFRGLTAMIQADLSGRRLDGELLRELHDQCTTGVFAMSTLKQGLNTLLNDSGVERLERLTALPAIEQNAEDRMPPQVQLLVPDFRDGTPIYFMLESGKNLSEAGLEEMLATYNPDHPNPAFRLYGEKKGEEGEPLPPDPTLPASQQGPIKLFAPAQPHEELAARADDIFNRHSEHIAGAAPGDAKLRAIARCCQELERSHLFDDGNARTVGFLVLNKLLLENGLPPAMFEDPNRIDGFSANELVEEIKRGQETFAQYARGH